MGNTKVNQRSFVVKAGMTPEDIVKSANATPQQKKYAVIFDSDGIKGYSQREADIFNATTITERGNQGISLWTRCADGSKKETKFKGDIASFKFVPQEAVKPYKMARISQKETTPKIQLDTYQHETFNVPTVTVSSEMVSSLEEMETNVDSKEDPLHTTDQSNLSIKNTYPNGIIEKSIAKNAYRILSDYYYENGRTKSHIESEWNGQKYIVRSETGYYPSGKVKTEYTNDKEHFTLTQKDYYETGLLKSYKIKGWNGQKYIDRKITEYYPNGKKKFEYTNDKEHFTLTQKDYYETGLLKSYKIKGWNGQKYIDRKITEYYPNGKKKFEYTNDKEHFTLTQKDYNETGLLKSYKISGWNGRKYIDRKITEYYSNGRKKFEYTNDDLTKTLTQTYYYDDGMEKSNQQCKWNGKEYKLVKDTKYDSQGNITDDYDIR